MYHLKKDKCSKSQEIGLKMPNEAPIFIYMNACLRTSLNISRICIAKHLAQEKTLGFFPRKRFREMRALVDREQDKFWVSSKATKVCIERTC